MKSQVGGKPEPKLLIVGGPRLLGDLLAPPCCLFPSGSPKAEKWHWKPYISEPRTCQRGALSCLWGHTGAEGVTPDGRREEAVRITWSFSIGNCLHCVPLATHLRPSTKLDFCTNVLSVCFFLGVERQGRLLTQENKMIHKVKPWENVHHWQGMLSLWEGLQASFTCPWGRGSSWHLSYPYIETCSIGSASSISLGPPSTGSGWQQVFNRCVLTGMQWPRGHSGTKVNRDVSPAFESSSTVLGKGWRLLHLD